MLLSRIAAIIETAQPHTLAGIRRNRMSDHVVATLTSPDGLHEASFALSALELSIGIDPESIIATRATDAAEELRAHLAKLEAA